MLPEKTGAVCAAKAEGAPALNRGIGVAPSALEVTAVCMIEWKPEHFRMLDCSQSAVAAKVNKPLLPKYGRVICKAMLGRSGSAGLNADLS